MIDFKFFSKKKKRGFAGSKKKAIDWLMLLLVVGLTFFGILMVYNVSVPEALQVFGDKFFYAKYQLLWGISGFFLALFAIFINYKFWKKVAPVAFFFNIFLLVLVLIPGVASEIKGARRWLNFGFFSFQPAEALKLTMILYLSMWFEKKRPFWQFLVLIISVLFLVALQPDLGTSLVIILSCLAVYFVSNAPIFHFLAILLMGTFLGIGLIFFSSYRRERILTFFNPTRDPLGSSYHLRQILIALGSGGFLGLGLGHSRQKYQFLPEATTDSIFAVIAEELGFLGALIIIIAFMVLIIKGFKIAQVSPDRFSQMVATGITTWIGIQLLINLGSIVSLLPLTGLPLPFISYGGSSLIVSLLAMGILLNISKHSSLRS